MRKELYERIHLHTGSDYEEFFKKFIPRSHMPSDYGGDLESVLELHEKNTKLLEDMNQYFLLEEDQMMMKYENYLPDADEEDDDFYDAEDEWINRGLAKSIKWFFLETFFFLPVFRPHFGCLGWNRRNCINQNLIVSILWRGQNSFSLNSAIGANGRSSQLTWISSVQLWLCKQE